MTHTHTPTQPYPSPRRSFGKHCPPNKATISLQRFNLKHQVRPGHARGLAPHSTLLASVFCGALAMRAPVSPRPRASLPMRRAV
jgi:hypothetical protein